MDADRCVMTPPAPARLQSQRPPPFTERVRGVELLQRAGSGNTVKTEHREREQHIASCDTGQSLDADSVLSSIASVLSSDQIAAVVVNLLTSFTVSRVLLLPPNLLHHSRGT